MFFTKLLSRYPTLFKYLHVATPCKLQVFEEGTRAAGATEVDMLLSYEEPTDDTPFKFVADHPFLYLIADNQKNIYFIGTFYG